MAEEDDLTIEDVIKCAANWLEERDDANAPNDEWVRRVRAIVEADRG